MKEIGYHAKMVGKNHFDPLDEPNDELEGISHGFETIQVYDGQLGREDDYWNWFVGEKPGFTPIDNIPDPEDKGGFDAYPW